MRVTARGDGQCYSAAVDGRVVVVVVVVCCCQEQSRALSYCARCTGGGGISEERDRVRASSPRPHFQTGPATFQSSARREKKDGDMRVNCVSDCPVTVSVRLKALVWLVVVVPVVVVTVTGQTTPNHYNDSMFLGKRRVHSLNFGSLKTIQIRSRLVDSISVQRLR